VRRRAQELLALIILAVAILIALIRELVNMVIRT
jgi:hypothetical protein